MRTTKCCAVLALTLPLALAAALPAAAEIELTPTIGYRFHDYSPRDPRIACVAPPCDFFVDSEDGASYGLVAGYGLGGGWALELLLNRQEAEMRADSGPAPDLEITHLQGGLAHTWGDGTVRPFVAAAAGVSQVDNAAPFTLDPDADAFSLSAGGGVKIAMTDLLALRLEARGYWIDLPQRVEEDLTQTELSVGLSFRF